MDLADDDPYTSRWATLFGVLASLCFFGGAISLIDASAGWQGVLNTVATTQIASALSCTARWKVSGWGEGSVLLLTVAGLGLLTFNIWLSVRMARPTAWDQLRALAALVPVGLLWTDAFIVGRSQSASCHGSGLTGAAGAAINRAGWLFLGAAIFSVLTWASTSGKGDEVNASA